MIVHRHGGEDWHSHEDDDSTPHGADVETAPEGMAPAPAYAGHQDAGAQDATAGQDATLPPPMPGSDTDSPSLAEATEQAQDTPTAKALRESQDQGYIGQDAADLVGEEKLREQFGAAKDGPGAPDYPPGHPNDPTVPPSAGTAGPAASEPAG